MPGFDDNFWEQVSADQTAAANADQAAREAADHEAALIRAKELRMHKQIDQASRLAAAMRGRVACDVHIDYFLSDPGMGGDRVEMTRSELVGGVDAWVLGWRGGEWHGKRWIQETGQIWEPSISGHPQHFPYMVGYAISETGRLHEFSPKDILAIANDTTPLAGRISEIRGNTAPRWDYDPWGNQDEIEKFFRQFVIKHGLRPEDLQ